MKRTKEKWEVRKNGSQLGILAKLSDKPSEGGYRIVVGRNDIGKGYILDEADAQLIAAAPDLLEACKKLLALHDEAMFICGVDDDEYAKTVSAIAISEMRAAITKAETLFDTKDNQENS
ncbi:MAG: hypothetical protein PHG53_09435 [Phycisphaerae bacterium]|nr:hypothetical protein [Phycisphaerae bacterium]